MGDKIPSPYVVSPASPPKNRQKHLAWLGLEAVAGVGPKRAPARARGTASLVGYRGNPELLLNLVRGAESGKTVGLTINQVEYFCRRRLWL